MTDTSAKSKVLPIWAGLLLAACSGVLMACSFIPVDWSGCVWVGFLPLLTALWKGPKRGGKKGIFTYALYGWVFGVVWIGISLWWLNEVSTLGYIALMIFYAGVFPAIWAAFTAGAFRPALMPVPAATLEPAERRQAWRAWAFKDMPGAIAASVGAAALWVCLEWVRGWIIPGFGWNNLGVALYGNPLAQWAEFIGVTGLAFIPAVFGCWLWCAGRRAAIMVTNEGRRSVPWDFFGLVSVLLMMFVVGVTWISAYAPQTDLVTGQGKKMLPVMCVQLNLSQLEKWDRSNRGNIYQSLLNTTADGLEDAQMQALTQAAESGLETGFEKPAWVIWPESSFPASTFSEAATGKIFPNQDNVVFMSTDTAKYGDLFTLNTIRREYGDFILLTGTDEMHVDSTGKVARAYNCLTVFEKDYDTAKIHPKVQLVPFGEYIPFRKSLPILEKAFEFSAGMAMGVNFEKGQSSSPIPVPARPGSAETIDVIPLICFEDVVGAWVRKFARPVPQVMVNVTNDGWFNQSWANEQHWRNAAFRCIELRRTMVRCANTGVSVALAPNGAVIKDLRLPDGSPFLKGSMYVMLPVGCTQMTLYAVLGDWFIIICLMLAVSLFLRRLTARHKNTPGTVVDGVYVKKR